MNGVLKRRFKPIERPGAGERRRVKTAGTAEMSGTV
jgi:hypothetical protein